MTTDPAIFTALSFKLAVRMEFGVSGIRHRIEITARSDCRARSLAFEIRVEVAQFFGDVSVSTDVAISVTTCMCSFRS